VRLQKTAKGQEECLHLKKKIKGKEEESRNNRAKILLMEKCWKK